jgi:hypothetical protein
MSYRASLSLLGVFVFAWAVRAGADDAAAQRSAPPSLAEVDRLVAKERARVGADGAEPGGSAQLRQKRNQCVRAIGDRLLCGCLADELATGTSFAEYIRVVTATPDELGYADLSAGEREHVDSVVHARDVCVRRAYAQAR